MGECQSSTIIHKGDHKRKCTKYIEKDKDKRVESIVRYINSGGRKYAQPTEGRVV